MQMESNKEIPARIAFLVGAVSGAAVMSSSLYLWQRSGQWWKTKTQEVSNFRKSSQDQLPLRDNAQRSTESLADGLDDEIISEHFTRNVQFFGAEGQRRVFRSFIIVVGLGGVGSHAAHMLLRAGVGRLRIIDFDQVSLSSLNRHALATRADVGQPKASVLKGHFEKIVPEAQVEAICAMFTAENQDALLAGRPDFVIDAIDDSDTKVALLAACKAKGLEVLCVCGAGAKADPTRVKIADIRDASSDPLARKVRHRLRSQHNISGGIPLVISAEKPRCSLIPVEELSHQPHDLQVVPNFRVRTVPVLGTQPAVFGMAAASWVLCSLAKQPFIPDPLIQVKEKEYSMLLHRLILREEVVFDNPGGVGFDVEDIMFLARDVWKAQSAKSLTAEEKALARFLDRLQFTRWDRQRPAQVDNLVLLWEHEADEHDQADMENLKKSDPEFVARVENVLSHVRTAFGINPQN